MGKRVVIIASGETELRALPHLVSVLRQRDIVVSDVQIPPFNGHLDIYAAERLIRKAWYDSLHQPPDKFVVLVDTDGKEPDEVLKPFRDGLPSRLSNDISADILFACAQWHLEAWFFGDEQNLRSYVGGSLGNVDASSPDQIKNPKLHLRNLLGDGTYNANVSEAISREVDPQTIAAKSPSFRSFLDAVSNGGPAGD